MAILNLQNYVIVGAVALIIGALVSGITVWNIRGNTIDSIKQEHELALKTAELQAANATSELNKYKLDFATNLGDKKDEIQSSYNQSIASIRKSVDDLAKRRLQDPHANSGTGTTTTPGGTSGGDTAGTGAGLLSEQASQFLFAFAGESDERLEELRQCQAWNAEVEAQYNQYRNSVLELIADLKKKGIMKD